MIKKLLILIFILININAQELELSGTVISDNEKVITSRNIGFIKAVHISEGSFVKKGQLLYEIDSSSIDSLKKEAKLNLQIQENTLKNIQINYNRYKNLYAQDLVPRYDLEQLELKLLNTKNMIDIAKAKIKEVNAQYSYLKIKAPNDALVIKKSIKAGEMAMPGVPALILSDISDLKIKTSISESNLSSVKVGQKIEVSIPSANINTIGKVESLIPNINSTSHSFTLKIAFKYDKKLYPGMYAKLKLKIEE